MSRYQPLMYPRSGNSHINGGSSSYGYGSGTSRYSSRQGSAYDRLGGLYSGSSYSRPSYDPGRYKPRYPSWKGAVDNLDNNISQTDYSALDLHEEYNTVAHHTDQYGVPGLVLRRGQEFKVTLRLDKGYTPDKYNIKIQFSTGDEPKVTKNTLIRLSLGADELTPKEWGANISKQYSEDQTEGSRQCVDVFLMSACDAIVGKYNLSIDMRPKEGYNHPTVGRKSYKYKEEIYFIFNPWCEDDQVYMSDAACREEYVMNETGKIYVGQAKSVHGRPWNFGQFGKRCLEAAIYLMEKSYLRKSAHGNPTLVCRAMSAMANSNDEDGGVLTGNWTGEYRGGTAPTQWNGSVAILERFMQFKRPVRYGQCWVFSGLLTTLMRSVGIPTRSVTNFESAHDKDFSMSIDTHVDTDGRPIRELDDSVWNFHVWNESWFERPDLPAGYGGWQAYDATPQEQSDSLMQCGPAPVKAIKEGNVFLGYDTRFLFAEVNGDRITWMLDPAGNMVATDVDLHGVGCSISTKQVGSPFREDLTSQYKYEEGSKEEREAVKRASQHSSKKDVLKLVYGLRQRQDVQFSFEGHVQPNGDVNFDLTADNTASETRTMHVRMHTTAKYYTGVPGKELGSTALDASVEGGKGRTLNWSAHAHQYINLVAEDASVGIYVMVKVKETGQIYTTQKTFSVEKPQLDVMLEKKKVDKNEKLQVTVSFTNPLSVDLTSGSIMLEGPGIQKDMQILLKSFVKPGQTVAETVTLSPKYAGQREIIASFHSRQLTSIVGSATVQVI